MQGKTDFPCITPTSSYLAHPLNSVNLRPKCKHLSDEALQMSVSIANSVFDRSSQ